MNYPHRPGPALSRWLTSAAITTSGLLPMLTLADTPLPTPGFPQSAGVQSKSHNFTVETVHKAHEMGFGVIRRAFHWEGVEKKKGVYDFSAWDEQMAEADRLGITIVGCWFGSNKLHEDDGRGGIQTQAGRRAFAAFAAACAKRYKDHNVLWEVWNEPNIRTFWRHDGRHNSTEFAREYTDLVKAIMPAILEADPDAFVMAGSVSNYWKPSYEWTEDCFKFDILDTGIKGWSVHPYGVRTPEEFAVGHAITRDLLKQYGHGDMPILDTERGFAVNELSNNEGWSGGERDRVMQYQAWHFVRQYMVDQINNVPISVWYEWDGKDPWTGSAFALFNPEPRPILTAATVMLDQLKGYRFVRRIETGYDLDYVVLYENETGARKLVAWTAPAPGDTPDAAFPHEVQISIGEAGEVQAVDVLGETVEVVDAGVGRHRLAVSGAPQYISVPGDSELTAASIEPYRAPIQAAAAPPANAVDLKLFEADDDWKFSKNTGEGLFEVKPGGESGVGVLHYNFTGSESRTTPYVLASTDARIEAGAKSVLIHARSPVRQQLTFRLTDATGQTHQYKHPIRGIEKWERIDIPLTRRLEHWGGANDGVIHYPIQSIVFSVPLPSEDHQHGKVEYSQVMVVPE